jgi:ATP-dependent Clp protease ATP-binding subunit ClpB
MNRFDQIVLGALDVAQSEALKKKNPELHPEHLLYGLAMNKSSYASKALVEQVKDIQAMIEALPRTTGQLSLETIRPSSKLQSARSKG